MISEKYITKEGFEKLSNELKGYLKKRAFIAKRIEEAKALGDLSENADYIKAKEEQSFNEGKIKEIENLLSNAEIIVKKNGNGVIGMNSEILVEDDKKNNYKYQIVGTGESDPLSGKISYESPMGRQFIGKRVGEIVEIETPASKKKYKIIKIN